MMSKLNMGWAVNLINNVVLHVQSRKGKTQKNEKHRLMKF